MHDVTAFGNYTKFGISSLVLSHFCGSIYVHIVLHLISFNLREIIYRLSDFRFLFFRSWRNGFPLHLSVFNYGNYAWIHEVSYYYRLYITYVIEDRTVNNSWCLASILEVHLSCSSSSFDHNTIYPIRFEFSPTNQNRPSIDTQIQRASQQHYLLATTRPENGQVKDIANITFSIYREDESRLISTSPTAHTPGYYWRGRTFLRPTEQLNLPYWLQSQARTRLH